MLRYAGVRLEGNTKMPGNGSRRVIVDRTTSISMQQPMVSIYAAASLRSARVKGIAPVLACAWGKVASLTSRVLAGMAEWSLLASRYRLRLRARDLSSVGSGRAPGWHCVMTCASGRSSLIVRRHGDGTRHALTESMSGSTQHTPCRDATVRLYLTFHY